MRVRSLLLAVGLVLLLSVRIGGALEVPLHGARDGGEAVLLSNADGASPYVGIARVLGRATCSGVFVATVDDEEDPGAAPAYVLTNGHCPEFPGANDVLVDRPAGRGQAVFNYFVDTTRAQVAVPVASVAYATMKGQDLAVLQLAIGYGALRRQGVEPWPIARARPLPDEFVAVVGAPQQRDPATAFLRLAACRLGGTAPVVLEHVWHWFDFHRNGCAGIQPGSSGSPVIARRSGQVVGLVNTTTVGGRPRYTECVIDHPCELLLEGETSRPDTSYVTPLLGLDRCFQEGWFDHRAEGCPLDPGDQVTLTPSLLGHVNPTLSQVPIGRRSTHWNVSVSGPFDAYRYKTVPAAAGDCRDVRGYGPPRVLAERPRIDDPLPVRDGWWFLCAIGGRLGRLGAEWQPVAFPAVSSVRVDTVRPRVEAPLVIDEDDLAWRVTFQGLATEIALYLFKAGRPADTRCDDAAGYRPALVPFVSLAKRDRPYLFCAIPFDAAGNPGTPIERVLS